LCRSALGLPKGGGPRGGGRKRRLAENKSGDCSWAAGFGKVEKAPPENTRNRIFWNKRREIGGTRFSGV